MIKINILSSGRYHVCDLARELDKCGFDVKFYSFVPFYRAKSFGLPSHCICSVVYFLAPFLFIEKCLFRGKRWARKIRIIMQDAIISLLMRDCDICIAMSGEFSVAIKKAKKRGSIIIIERGSKHILEQKRILEAIPSNKGKTPVPCFDVRRELLNYELANYISVGAQHVKDSFIKYGLGEKIFVNPYGVDLSMFKKEDNVRKEYDVIMVGCWSYQKGCDLIDKAISQTNYSFLHVGSIGDISFPSNPRCTHIDPVDQSQLSAYYNKARVFLLPSRQEGLAMVQLQAIACGLPIIGSYDSGAEDINEMLNGRYPIYTIKEHTVSSVVESLDFAISTSYFIKVDHNESVDFGNLTWNAYGRRYMFFLNKIYE